jgi:hypothetical protein
LEGTRRALSRRRVREQRLAGEARRQDVRVVLRILLPRADLLQLEHARLDVRAEHALLEAFDGGERVAADLVHAAQVAGERVRFAFDALLAQVLEQIVVRMDTVERRVRGMRLVEITEQVVDEVRKWFGNDHVSRLITSRPVPGRAWLPSRSAMVQ